MKDIGIFFEAYELEEGWVSHVSSKDRKFSRKFREEFAEGEKEYLLFDCTETEDEEANEKFYREFGVADFIKDHLCKCIDEEPLDDKMHLHLPETYGVYIVVCKENNEFEAKLGIELIASDAPEAFRAISLESENQKAIIAEIEKVYEKGLSAIWKDYQKESNLELIED